MESHKTQALLSIGDVNKFGKQEAVDFLMRNVKSPLVVTNEKWNESDFNIQQIFEFQPHLASQLFFDHSLSRCVNETLCLKHYVQWTYDKTLILDVEDVLKSLKLEKTAIETAFKSFSNVMRLKRIIQVKVRNSSQSETFRIKELPNRFPELHIDWLRFINSHQLHSSEASKEDEIIIESPEAFDWLSKAFAQMDKR